MGHNIHYDTCADNEKAQKACEAYWNEYAAKKDWQEGCSGLSKPIRWLKHAPFDTDDAAREYIEKNDNGCYDQLAVRFLQYPSLNKSKTYDVLKERADRLQARYEELRTKAHYEGVKASFIHVDPVNQSWQAVILENEYEIPVLSVPLISDLNQP